MKKREERDDQHRCDGVQTTVGSLACAGSTGNCGCDRTSPPHLRYGNTRRPFAARMTHAQISLRLVVVKRNRKIEQEAQHGPLAPRESIQQIPSRTLFGSPRCSLRLFRLAGCWRRGIGLVAFGQEGVIATKEVCQQRSIQFVLAQRFGSLYRGFHLQQELFHLPGPQLLEFFFDEGQLAQMMHVA